MAKVVQNYEDLTPEERRSVPTASYFRAKTHFSRALPHTALAQYPSNPIWNSAQRCDHTPTIADNYLRQRDGGLVVEELIPLPKAEN